MLTFTINQQGDYLPAANWETAEWLHFEDPTPDEVAFLMQTMGLPRDFIMDSLDRYEVPRQETLINPDGEKGHLLLVLYPSIKEEMEGYRQYQTFPMAVILNRGKFVTICKKTPPFLEDIYRNETDEEANVSKGEHIVLDILWELTRAYVRGLEDLDQTIENLEERIHTTENDFFQKLIGIHKSLVYFNTGITRNHVHILSLKEQNVFTSDRTTRGLLHDIENISNQAIVMVQESNQMIDQLSEVFSSVVSNTLNNIMKVLTSLTVILTIPTLIGAFWGMNVSLPFDEQHPLTFWLLLLLTILMCIVTMYWLKKNKYF